MINRKKKEQADPYKRLARTIEPFGFLALVGGFLTCCCGYVAEWARTFPLGDITAHTIQLRICGVSALVVAIILLSASHLLYYKNQYKKPKERLNYKRAAKGKVQQAPRTRNYQNDRKIQLIRTVTSADSTFWLGMLLCVFSLLLFFIGYISEWANTFPIRLESGSRQVCGILGIIGQVLSIIIMWAADAISTWIETNVLILVLQQDIATAEDLLIKENVGNVLKLSNGEIKEVKEQFDTHLRTSQFHENQMETKKLLESVAAALQHHS